MIPVFADSEWTTGELYLLKLKAHEQNKCHCKPLRLEGSRTCYTALDNQHRGNRNHAGNRKNKSKNENCNSSLFGETHIYKYIINRIRIGCYKIGVPKKQERFLKITVTMERKYGRFS